MTKADKTVVSRAFGGVLLVCGLAVMLPGCGAEAGSSEELEALDQAACAPKKCAKGQTLDAACQCVTACTVAKKCASGFGFDEDSCSCVPTCQQAKKCDTGTVFDESTCSRVIARKQER